MERLTEHYKDNGIKINGCSTIYANVERKGAPASNAIVRLAAYEDTGLGPEEIEVLQAHVDDLTELFVNTSCGGAVSYIRLAELAQAEKNGRLVVLPGKVGDIVYHITTCEHFPRFLDGTMYDDNGGLGIATGSYCHYELSEKCPFVKDFDCNKTKNKLAVFEDEIESFYIYDSGISIGLCYSGSVNILDFGKTVFLTREEAEAALKKMKETDDE